MLAKKLISIYESLYRHFGPRHWWPGDTRFEIIIGAILTQNTNWKNVEKAISNLKKEKLLTPKRLHKVPAEKLARLIRPAGYYNIKAGRVKEFMGFLFSEYRGDLAKMFRQDTHALRDKLLSVKGIGPETADSILLYAGNKPVFVVDAYTKRILSRHKMAKNDASYHQVQELFMGNLKKDVKIFNEYHALLVELGKAYCRPKGPKCARCPIKGI